MTTTQQAAESKLELADLNNFNQINTERSITASAAPSSSTTTLTRAQIGNKLYDVIKQEVEDGDDFTWTDAVRILSNGVTFLRQFDSVPNDKKHEILINTVRRFTEDTKGHINVNVTTILELALTASFGSSGTTLADAVIKCFVKLFNLTKTAIYKKFDLNEDGKITMEEVETVVCAPCKNPAGCCGGENAQFTDEELNGEAI